MEDIVYKIFDTRMFENILFVDENPASIKTEYTSKQDGELVKTQIENIYNLSSKVYLDDLISDSLIHKFFVNLNFKSDTKEIKYFKRNSLRRLFKRLNFDDLLKHIEGHDWVITNDVIVKEFEKSPDFEILDSKSEIKLVGKINNTLIYLNPFDSDSKMYLGKKESITALFKKNTESIEYTYHSNGNLNKLIVS